MYDLFIDSDEDISLSFAKENNLITDIKRRRND